jgi:hypothetical protein
MRRRKLEGVRAAGAWAVVRLIESKHHAGVAHPAIVLRHGDVVIVGFRGTKDWDDARADLKVKGFKPYRGEWGSVHRGFWFALDEVWPELRVALAESKGSNVWLTGHSLGGALALLAAARIVKEGGEIEGVYTFGQPSVCDFDLVALTGDGLSGYFRLINGIDAVAEARFGLHYGAAKYFDSAGRLFDGRPSFCQHTIDLWIEKSKGMKRRLHDSGETLDHDGGTSAQRRRKPLESLEEISAHQMTKYVQLLEKRLGLPDALSSS